MEHELSLFKNQKEDSISKEDTIKELTFDVSKNHNADKAKAASELTISANSTIY